MTTPMRITVGVDAEEASAIAVDWAIRQARRTPVALTLLTAIDMLLDVATDAGQHLEREAERVRAEAPGTEVATAVVEGSIHQTLRTYSERSDLLVIGSHRSRHWRSVLSGNLPARVASTAGCPVVVVPDDWQAREGRVLVGLDDDTSSDDALDWAAATAEASGCELEILHGWMRPDPPTDPVSLYLSAPPELKQAHRETLSAAAERIRADHPKLRVRETLFDGPPASGLSIEARAAELVVIGSHRRGPLVGIVLGSVARELLRFADAPVCVVPTGASLSR